MKRKEAELFSLSFLDLLFGALGAVIFLYIIVPKGGAPPDPKKVIPMSIDSNRSKFFGDFQNYTQNMSTGDTFLMVVTGYGQFPSKKDCPPPIKCPPCPEPEVKPQPKTPDAPVSEKTNLDESPLSTVEPSVNIPNAPVFICKFAVELHWLNKQNNVDLRLCKDNQCVSGQKKNNSKIGRWDSGVVTNTFKDMITKKDLRSTMEAIRQKDNVIPGIYEIQAKFKESSIGEYSVETSLFIYSERNGNPQREMDSKILNISNEFRTIGRVELMADGTFKFTGL